MSSLLPSAATAASAAAAAGGRAALTAPLTVLEAAILEAIRAGTDAAAAGGVTDGEIQQRIGIASTTLQRATAYNTLLHRGRIRLLRRSSDAAVLYGLEAEDTAKLAGLSVNETALYKTIEAAHNRGIWSRDLRSRTNLPKMQLEKALRELERRSLVKTVKFASQRNKKIYMLYGVEPAQELTGGPWFNEQHEYDTEFIRIICQQVLVYIKETPYVSSQHICERLNSSGVFKERLMITDVEQLLRTMVYDNSLVELLRAAPDGAAATATYYRPKPVPLHNALTDVPCGVCPLTEHCEPNGIVSPETCRYMDEWLKAIDW